MMKKILFTGIALLWATLLMGASQGMPQGDIQEAELLSPDTLALSEMILPDTIAQQESGESSSRFLPMRRRIDRHVERNKFVYKGEVMLGLSASYATLSSEDSDFLLVLEHINADGSVATIKPFVGYAYKDNHAVGVRFGYTHLRGDIDNLGFNLGEQNDLSGALEGMAFDSDNFSFAIFHRSYVGIDAKGRFGVFGELEASVHSGTSRFSYLSGEELKYNNSENIKVKLSFNPGVAVYIFPNVCGTLSFGLGGLQYAKVTQHDDAGNKVGSREASKLRFRLNLADINIGVTVHLWDKKKTKR
uniref:hypothetical protein n=1 Tax=Alistipes sp. TaxID=1872444 RepID=UPI0040560B14